MSRLQIFTDGTAEKANPDKAAWSFVVVGARDEGHVEKRKLCGWSAGRVDGFGVEKATNIAAELTALAYALIFVGQVLKECPDIRITIVADCQPAIDATVGKTCIDKQGILSRFNAYAHQAVARKAEASLTLCWVKGHSGNPYNELADYIA